MATLSAVSLWVNQKRTCTVFWNMFARKYRRIKPRYLMGVGKPEDLVEAVRRGHRYV